MQKKIQLFLFIYRIIIKTNRLPLVGTISRHESFYIIIPRKINNFAFLDTEFNFQVKIF